MYNKGKKTCERGIIMALLIWIALSVCIIGLFRAYRSARDIQKASLIMTGAISLAISILVFPYYARNNDLLIAVIDSFHAGVSGIALSVDGDVPYALGLEGNMLKIYRFFLYSLYVLGPIAGSMFLISFSTNVKNALSLFGMKRYFVFSSLNERSVLIAESIFEKKIDGKFIFCNCEDEELSLTNRVRGVKGVMLKTSEDELSLRKKAKYEFFEIYDDKKKCIAATSNLCGKLPKKKNYDSENIIVRIFADDSQRELILNLDEQYSDELYLRHVDEQRSLAIDALSLSIDTLAVKKDLNVVIVCEDKLGITFLKELLCLCIKPDGKNHFDFVGPDAKSLYQQFLSQNEEVKNYDIEVHDASYGKETAVLQKDVFYDAVYILYKDDEASYRCARQMRRNLSSNDKELRCAKIFCLIRDPDLYSIIKEEDIVLFGDYKTMNDYEKLVNPDLEKAAEKVHLSYLGETKDEKNILENSGFYEYQNQESSFAEALALKYKEKYILSFKQDEQVSDKQFIENWLNDEDNLNRMAVAEHERWNAYERVHGYKRANEVQTKAIIVKYKGKRANDPKLRLHPAIVDYDELKAVEDRVNQLFEEYGSQTRVNYIQSDKDIVKKLTYILETK